MHIMFVYYIFGVQRRVWKSYLHTTFIETLFILAKR